MMLVKKMFAKVMSVISAMAMAATMAAYIPANAAEECTDEQAATLIKEVAILVNEARKESGLKPLDVLPYLNEDAQIRAL